jgi:hypothetical protein
MAVIVRWRDDTLDIAPTAEKLIKQIASDQWHEYTPEEMIQVLSDRAWNMWNAAIDPEWTLQEFFTRLAAAGLCEIVQWDEGEGA